MPNDTKQRLIEVGLKRFYRDGFRNVGLDQILADVGISKTAFYKHFECKEDLMIAVLRSQELWMQETFRSMVRERGGDNPESRLRALLGASRTLLGGSGCVTKWGVDLV